uniref:Uncharacterized protein n=1 Tax=Oryza brachyantha TaxID=4533 RepID=J3NCD4_ORYBR
MWLSSAWWWRRWSADGGCWRGAERNRCPWQSVFLAAGRVLSLFSNFPPFYGRTLLWLWGTFEGGLGLRPVLGDGSGLLALPLFFGRQCEGCFYGGCGDAGESLAVPWAGLTTMTLVGAVSLPRGVVVAFSPMSRNFPGENLVPIFGRAAVAFHVVSLLGASLRGSHSEHRQPLASELLAEGVTTLSNDDMVFAISPQVVEAAICLVGILATMSLAAVKLALLGHLGG